MTTVCFTVLSSIGTPQSESNLPPAEPQEAHVPWHNTHTWRLHQLICARAAHTTLAFLPPCAIPGDYRGGKRCHEPHYVNRVQGHVPVKPQCRARSETEAEAVGRQKPGPSVDGGNPRNLIHRVVGDSVSVCSTPTDGRGAEQFEGHN